MATYEEMQAQIDKIAAEENLNIKTSTLQTSKAVQNVQKKVETAQATNAPIQYTLFASGLNNGGRNTELKNKNYTTDLAILFDVVDTHSYTRTVDKTSYSTEDKVKYSDHAVIEDGKFTFSARVNTSPMYLIENSYIDKDTDPNNPLSSKRPEKALAVLEKLITDRQLVSIVTEDRILTSYILTSLEATRSTDEGAALVFNLEFTEFRTFVLGKTINATIYTSPKKSKKKQKGATTSSANQEDIEFYEMKSPFLGKLGKDVLAPGLDAMGVPYKVDQVAGTISPTGVITRN